ncbi:glycosyltransferase family 2 protein [Flavobacterium sp. GSA192]|uniref:glycosyltransferase family 2 protein n=1 Tax=Flavobacterium sp. GSA192 TaxID=2576304 RepID=UPI00112A1C12|nr:glycosyltransferase family A protein [Flavobacterium sp. GSA192]
MFITIFTPTYNRADLLKRVYDSLLLQGNSNFEWLIVDDGSIDNTKEFVEQFINEDKIIVRYFYKSNGGKHTAINYGVQKAKGDLFFIVDSDDFLTINAVQLKWEAWQKIKNNDKIAGIIGLSQFTNGTFVGDVFLEDNWQISFVDYYLKYKLQGDKSVAFKTAVLKQYPFPEKEGVKLVFEAVVWHEMAKKYDVLCLNKVIQLKEYLENGLTDSSYKLWYAQSMAYSFYKLIDNGTYSISKYPKAFIWNYIHLCINSLLADENYFWQLKGIVNKIIYVLVYPRAYFSYLRMKSLIVK